MPPFTVTPTNQSAPAIPAGDKPQSAKDRAIQAFVNSAQQHSPVQNASRVAPEELGAITQQRQVPETTQQSTQSTQPVDQNNTSESQTAVTAPETPPALSPQFAQLARKEKAIRAQVSELKAREAAIAAREAALAAPKAPEFDPNQYIPKSKLNEDVLGALSEAGISYDQIVQAAMNQPSQEQQTYLQEIKKLSAKIEALENETKGTKKSIEEQQTQAYQQAVGQIRTEAKKLVFTDPSYEAIKATNSVEDVVELIKRTFDEDGTLLTVEEAAQYVEDELIEKISKYSSLSKIQKLQAAKKPQAQATTSATQQQPQSAKTLSNSMTSSKPLTAKERAILAFENKLNKS